MALSAAQIEAAIGNRRAAKALSDYTDTLGRVPHIFIGDSNMMKDDYGFVGAFAHRLSGRYPTFSTGIMGSRHYRSTQRGGHGWAWPYYASSLALSGGGVRNKLDFTGATWTNGTLTLTGTFTGYTGKAGDLVTITAGANATAGDYVVVSGNSTTIVLATTIGASATTGIGGSITPAAGASGFSSIPTAFHSGWNMPDAWLPIGACMVYDSTGTADNSANMTGFPKQGYMPVNGTLTFTVAHLLAAGAGSIRPGIGHYDGTVVGIGTYASLMGTPPAISTNGVDGTLSFARATKGPADHIASAYASKEYMATMCPGFGQVDTSPLCYLFSYTIANAVATGISTQGFLCRGGRHLGHILDVMNFLSNNSWANYLSTVADQCSVATGGSGDRRVCVWIASGFNDHGNGVVSADGVNLGSTAAGYKANLKAVINRFKNRWDASFGAGTSDTEVYFMVMPPHPIHDEPSTSGTITDRSYREGLSAGYRRVARDVCDEIPNVISIDLFALLGPSPFSQIYNRSFTMQATGDPDVDDVIHLQPAGYNWIAGMVVDAISANPYGGGLGPYVIDENVRGTVRP